MAGPEPRSRGASVTRITLARGEAAGCEGLHTSRARLSDTVDTWTSALAEGARATGRMVDPMKIAQITDTHISADGGPRDGVDMRESFLWALDAVRASGCELLVLSGDLVGTDVDFDAYPWIAQQVAALDIPSLVLSGNHDDTRRLAEAFDARDAFRDGCLFDVREMAGVVIYGLDTSSQRLSNRQLEWLEADLARRRGARALLFLHHPPIVCGCRFMDSHGPLLDREKVWRRIVDLGAIDHVFCGHYHTHKVVERDGIQVVICPSTMLQISQQSVGFEIEHRRPGYLEIDVDDDGVRWNAVYRA